MPDRKIEKSIWLEMEYLREMLRLEDNKASRPKLSAAAIADKLNKIGAKEPAWQTLNTGRMHDIRAVKMHMRAEQQSILLKAILDLKTSSNIPQISEEKIEEIFASTLPSAFSETPTPFEGEILGEDTDFLFGVWQFFYHSPTGRKGAKPEFRGIAVILRRAGAQAKFMECEMFSGHNRWRGRAFINKHNLYLMCSNLNQPEAAFFITNRPTKEISKVIGIGANLDRNLDHTIRPAVGFTFFGVKYAPDSKDSPDETIKLLEDAAGRKRLNPADEKTIRQKFCRTYEDIKSLRKTFPDLCRYIDGIKINEKTGFRAQWLRVAW